MSEINSEQMIKLLRKACDDAGGQREWARAHKVSEGYVSDCIHSRRKIGKLIAVEFGYKPVVVYQKENGVE